MARNRGCRNNPDVFCYTCGEFTIVSNRKKIDDLSRILGMKLGDQEKSWASHIVCETCVEDLHQQKNGKRNSLKFGVPMIWHERQNHYDDCYFCALDLVGPVGRLTTLKEKYEPIKQVIKQQIK